MPKTTVPPRSARERDQRQITAQLANTINQLRDEQGLTDERLAGRSGLTLYKLRGIKRRHVDPTLTTVLALCRGLDVKVETLLGDLPLPEAPLPSSPAQSLPETATRSQHGQHDFHRSREHAT